MRLIISAAAAPRVAAAGGRLRTSARPRSLALASGPRGPERRSGGPGRRLAAYTHAMRDRSIWDLLKRDHELVAGLIQRIRAADEDTGRALLGELIREFTAHARAEEAVVFGHLIHDERTQTQVLAGLEENKAVDNSLAELELLPHGDDKWGARVALLADAIRRHVRDVDDELGSVARHVMGDGLALELGERYVAERARVKADLSGLDEAP